MESYRHTQIGHVIRWSMRASALISFVALWFAGRSGELDARSEQTIAAVALVLFFAMSVLFGSLTVIVDDERVVARFGPGPLRFRYALADVRAARAVRNAWWHGWGIRLTPHGWLFNVSGLDAVELELKNGRRVRIGTDQPRELVEALAAALRR